METKVIVVPDQPDRHGVGQQAHGCVDLGLALSSQQELVLLHQVVLSNGHITQMFGQLRKHIVPGIRSIQANIL